MDIVKVVLASMYRTSVVEGMDIVKNECVRQGKKVECSGSG